MEINRSRKLTIYFLSFSIIFIFVGLVVNFHNNYNATAQNEHQTVSITASTDLHLGECKFWVDVEGAVMNPGVYCLADGDLVQTAIQKAGGFNMKAVAYRWVQKNINLSCSAYSHQKIYIPFKDDIITEKAPSESTDLKTNDSNIKDLFSRMSHLETYCNNISESFAEITQTCTKSNATEEVNNNGNSLSIETTDSVDDDMSESENKGGTTDDSSNDNGCVNINTATLDELDGLQGIGASTAQKIIDARPYSEIEDIKNVSGIGDSKYEQIKNEICI